MKKSIFILKANLMFESHRFIVVDLETTGLEPKLDQIIEIACVEVHNGEIISEWSELVNPRGIYVPQIITDITKITTEMLRDKPVIEAYEAPLRARFGENAVFVAHNVDFDRNFLLYNMKIEDMSFIKEKPYLCTFKLFKTIFPNLPCSYGLGSLARHHHVALEEAHRALDDARATAKLLILALGELNSRGLSDLHEIPTILQAPKDTKPEAQSSLF